MISNSNLLSNLLSNRVAKDPSKDLEGQEALTRLAHNPDLTVFLAWLDWQNSTALQPVDLTHPNLLAVVGKREGFIDLTYRIAKLFENR